MGIKKFFTKHVLIARSKIVFALCFISLTTLYNFPLFAAETTKIIIEKIEFSDDNKLEITLSQKTNFKSFSLKNPDRLVVDIENAQLTNELPKLILPSFVTSARNGIQQNNLRLVFDLNQQITVNSSSFRKIKNQSFGKIIVGIEAPHTASNSPKTTYKLAAEQESPKKINIVKKLPIIVIDAGHGGKDPGTIGDYARTKEKNITLSYAKELRKSLENTKRYKVFLTRDDDTFIPLRQRVQKARKLKADLFVSLHANSIAEPRTSGFSIYTLSEKSSDKQAELLAQKENRADIIHGIDFSGASPDIMKILIDLSQRESMNSSSNFANIVIKSVRKSEVNILQNTHRFAGFMVLTAPDMASVLIELGYLSNATEEKKLNNLIYKRKIAASLTEAIDEYFHQTPSKQNSKHE